jgi:hypothetical protein
MPHLLVKQWRQTITNSSQQPPLGLDIATAPTSARSR